MEIGEYFIIQLLVWSTNFFPKKKIPDFFRTKLMWVGARSGLGLGLGLWLELVSKVMFRAFFEIYIIPSHNTGTTRGPHQIPRFLYFILDSNQFVR